MNVIKDNVVVWEVPADMKEIVVDIFNADRSYVNGFSITRYITVQPGQLIRVTSK